MDWPQNAPSILYFCTQIVNLSIVLFYSQKIWRGIKFGILAVYLCDRQIKIRQYFILAYNIIGMVIPYRTTKFKSANILQSRFKTQPPNLIPVHISGYPVSNNVLTNNCHLKVTRVHIVTTQTVHVGHHVLSSLHYYLQQQKTEPRH